MPVPIIQRRLEKTIFGPLSLSKGQRPKHQGLKRRGTYSKGIVRFTEHQTVKLTLEQMTKLKELSNRLKVERGTLCRDALDIYFWLAEQERIEDIGTWQEGFVRHKAKKHLKEKNNVVDKHNDPNAS